MKKAKFQIMQKTNIKYERDEAEIETRKKHIKEYLIAGQTYRSVDGQAYKSIDGQTYRSIYGQTYR